ncbi:MAG: signal recognition particle-docking protein FtsY [Deltaproteobacteria bacterium]|nr:signal recognition particle-docking protein FtsY [Deltaproteobacteria bacterium]
MDFDIASLRLYVLGAVAVLILLILLVYSILRRRKQKKEFSPLTEGLRKSQRNFSDKINVLVGRGKKIDAELFSTLEQILIEADVGVKTTQKLLQFLHADIDQTGKQDIRLLKHYLKQELVKILEAPPRSSPASEAPQVILVVGINGVGKTTTIGKLAKKFRVKGLKVLLACADTFRSGAINQLKIWAERVGANTLAQQEGADPAAVAYDAVKAGAARGIDVVIIDTAGRLHTKVNLMEEMKKIKRVLGKAKAGTPHEVLMVIDATMGQNALNQAREFHEALGLTGLILSKLDGTAKGGIAVAIRDELNVPIQYIGIGERIDDLREFSAKEFVDALLN